jgi:hypothetical protein
MLDSNGSENNASAATVKTALVKYDSACHALAEARSVDEVKDIRDKAVAMAAYARQAKNKDLEADAVEIRMRATRRIDQLRQAQKETVGLATGKEGKRKALGFSDNPSDRPTLASQGVDKNLAQQGRVLGALSDEKFEAVVDEARKKVAHAVRRAVREIEVLQAREKYSLETPQVMLLSPGAGRKISVARNATKRQWLLAIGPDISRAALLEKQDVARESATVQQLQTRQWALQNKILEHEDELKDLRQQAEDMKRKIAHEVKNIVGPVSPFTETYDFQCDEATDVELAALPQRELVNRLLSARGTVGEGLRELQRGWWGDMQFMSYQPMIPGPGTGEGRRGFDGIGSPEWLAELFPDLVADK